MFDGKYSASINSPMGPINGVVTLMSKGNNAEGFIEIMGMKNVFKGMKIKEDVAKFSGNFNTPLGNIEYNAMCTVINDTLELSANTNKGNFKIQGKRMRN